MKNPIQTMLIYGRLRDLEALVWKTLSHPKLYVLICSATQSQLQQTQRPYINSGHLHRKDALNTVQHFNMQEHLCSYSFPFDPLTYKASAD